MRHRVVTVNDRMQQGYSYELTARVGRDFHPEFQPDLSPEEMLQLGVFCGKYLTDCRQPLSAWRKKGWIHPDDPRGWFQWYCRYYMGRRMPEEDTRQIRRWKAIRRHVAQLRKHCEPGDLAFKITATGSLIPL